MPITEEENLRIYDIFEILRDMLKIQLIKLQKTLKEYPHFINKIRFAPLFGEIIFTDNPSLIDQPQSGEPPLYYLTTNIFCFKEVQTNRIHKIINRGRI